MMLLMAGTLLVFLRRNIGVRLVPRLDFLFAAAVLIGLSYVEHPFDRQLATFAVLFLLLAFIHNIRHMRRIKRGYPEWHSYDTGQSWLFGFLPLPKTFVHVIIEPTLCALFGWWLSHRSDSTFYVGWWITISGGFLFNLENRLRIARRDTVLDLGDTVIESIHYSQRAEKFAEGAGRAGAAAGRASVRPQKSWLYALWKSALAAGQARRAQREADERRRRQQEQARAGAEKEQEQPEQEAEDAREAWSDPTAGRMTPEQALEVLELKPGATALEIRAAYNRLMQKVHPDAGGSTFFAKQLNMARDTLLKPQRKSG
jgi:hypothetical protein